MALKTRHLKSAPDQQEQRGGEVIGMARAFITRGKLRAEAEALRAAGRPLLSSPDALVTCGAVGRKLLEIADEIESPERAGERD